MLDSYISNARDSGFNVQETYQKTWLLSEIGSSGVLLDGDSNMQIQVISIIISSDTNTVVTLASGTDIIQEFALGKNVPFALNQTLMHGTLFAGSVGEDLNIDLSAAVTKGSIYLQYRYRDA